jgi:hypothetical protein
MEPIEMTLAGLMTPSQAATALGLHRNSLYEAMNAGRLQFVWVAGKRFISQAGFTQYQEQQGRRNGARTKKGEQRGKA